MVNVVAPPAEALIERVLPSLKATAPIVVVVADAMPLICSTPPLRVMAPEPNGLPDNWAVPIKLALVTVTPPGMELAAPRANVPPLTVSPLVPVSVRTPL